MFYSPMQQYLCHNVAGHRSLLHFLQPDDPPFFLFISINNPHAPYVTFKHYDSLYAPGKFKLLKKKLCHQPSFMRLLKQYSRFTGADDETFRKCAAVYLGKITYCDDMLGHVLNALDETGLSEETMVIATSDHGDFAGDYGLVEKWPNAFYDNLTKTPLIIRTPGAAAVHRVKELVSEIDILPTVLDMAQIPAGHDHFGKSLKPQLYGAKGDYTLICRTNGEHEFFDLSADPGECANEYANPRLPSVIAAMEKEMLLWYIKTADCVPHLD